MEVQVFGVRGSLPTPMSPRRLRDKLSRLLRDASAADLADDGAIAAFLDRSPHARCYGGNTSCVELRCGDTTVVLDAGSGIRGVTEAMAGDGRLATGPLHLLFTHFHWDHICGLPFFAPIYMPEREVNIWSWRAAEDIERILAVQMADAHFPIKWTSLPSRIRCRQLAVADGNQVGPAEVRLVELQHPDGAYGYRVEHEGHSVCYLTDTEVSKNPELHAASYVDFVAGADVVLVDAMYGFLDYHEHYNWGHSSIFTWIDFFKDSQIGELVVFHHDPAADDSSLDKLCDSARRYRELVAPQAQWDLSVAYEGQRWSL